MRGIIAGENGEMLCPAAAPQFMAHCIRLGHSVVQDFISVGANLVQRLAFFGGSEK
jgi:hypothetical protein